ncbi:MAG: hypothetical protein NY202_02045 [Mollicutes bacterium UO1]
MIIQGIAILQIIIFPIILILAPIIILLQFKKSGKISLTNLIALITFLIVDLFILGPIAVKNIKILTAKCKRCKGELDNKDKRIHAGA